MDAHLVAIPVRESSHWRSLEDMEIGEATKRSLELKLKKEQHKELLMDMRNFLMTTRG